MIIGFKILIMNAKEILLTWCYTPDDYCPNFNRGEYGSSRLCGKSRSCRLPDVMGGHCKIFNELVFERYFIDCMKKDFGNVHKITGDDTELS